LVNIGNNIFELENSEYTENSEEGSENILRDSLYALESMKDGKEEILQFSTFTEFVVDEIFQFNNNK
jgi:hypothetical protein